jgi:ribosomal protein L15E
MEFSVSDSPSVNVEVRRYDPALFPKFRVLFEQPQDDNPLRLLVQPSEESNFAAVMENHAEKDVTAMRYNCVMTSEDGNVKKHKVSSDSYMVDVYHPVLKTDDRLLICRTTTIH